MTDLVPMEEENKKITNSSKMSVLAALVTAGILMIIFGFGYRVVADKLSIDTSSLVIDPEILKEFPIRIGDWTGTEIPLDEKIIKATDTDARISRNYSKLNSQSVVWFYVAFGVKARDLMPHRPEVCYIGAGWTLTEKSSVDLQTENGQVLPVSIIKFKRGTLNYEYMLVLDYYIVDGQYCRDVSLLRSKVWQGSGSVGYVAQVQVVTPAATENMDISEKKVSSFAIESSPYLLEILNASGREKNQDSNNISTDNKGK
jgi:hypothetical protein